MIIGIIGNGFVGKATQILACPDVDIRVYDIVPELCIPKDLQLHDLVVCDIIFICLPTPMTIDGSCYTNLISDTIIELKKLKCNNITIRSTVPINYCNEHNVFFMPEFLTEQNWKNDFINNSHWIFGLTGNDAIDLPFKNQMTKLINYSYEHNCITSNDTIFMLSNEAEMLKLVKNTFLACKVGYFNEMYDLAKALNIDYETVINVASLDNRIGISHMKVPGYNNTRGYGGTCFPKDTHNLYTLFNKHNIKSYYIKNSLERNEHHDRPQIEHIPNRTVINIDKNVILVVSTRDLCKKLCMELVGYEHNFIIYPFEIKELCNADNFLCSYIEIHNPMFFPKINYIYFLFDENVVYDKKTIKGVYNILKLGKVHKCQIFFKRIKYVYSAIITEYASKHKIVVHMEE